MSKNKVKNIKYLLLFVYIIEFLYIIIMPELLAMYIFVNTVIQGFILLHLLQNRQMIEIKGK